MSRAEALPFSALPGCAFHTRARVRFGDCDPAGIVFFPAWFAMANAAIEDWFREGLGIDFHALHRDRRIGTGFVHVSADFFAPGLMGDEVAITPLVRRVGGASYALDVHIHRGEAHLVRLDLVTATTDLDARRARPVPDDLRAALLAYRDGCPPPDAPRTT